MATMTEREALEALLNLIDTRKGDAFYDKCCAYCYDDEWHSDRRYRPEGGGAAGDDMWRAGVPKCECPCHEARRIVGREDQIHDPRWTAPSRTESKP